MSVAKKQKDQSETLKKQFDTFVVYTSSDRLATLCNFINQATTNSSERKHRNTLASVLKDLDSEKNLGKIATNLKKAIELVAGQSETFVKVLKALPTLLWFLSEAKRLLEANDDDSNFRR